MQLTQENKDNHRYLLLGLTLLIVFIIARRAWLNDDAFITLRTVDNFVNGYGLTWNVNEHVQSFTHPSWMFILSGFYFFTREPFYTTIAVGLLFSTLSVYYLLRNFSENLPKILVVATTLMFSRAFIDYSTSGLENPLSHFLIILFFSLLVKNINHLQRKQVVILSAISSLGMLNRLDLFLVFAPSLVFILYKKKDFQTVKDIVIGQLPLLIWLIFSLVYYGYFVPNTAFAKLPSNILKKDLMTQGFTYFFHSLMTDPLTIVMILMPICFGFWQKNKLPVLIGLSSLLYLFYVIWIGGDFMEGRFFTVPLILSLVLFLNLPVMNFRYDYVLIGFILMLGLSIPHHTLTITEAFPGTNNPLSNNGITDERLYYFNSLGLLSRRRQQMDPAHQRKNIGLEIRDQGIPIHISEMVGMEGYYAGPNVHIIDKMGLCDPLLSKLPVDDPVNWRIGHFLRTLPAGYEDTIREDDNLIQDPYLSEYYDKIRIITRGRKFGSERISTIINMNLGKFDHLIEHFTP